MLKLCKKSRSRERSLHIVSLLGYRIGKTVGKGTYSKVYIAADRQGKKYACKIIDKKTAGEEFIKKFLPRELKILSVLDHPNIVKVFSILEVDSNVFLFMDYCRDGDLLEYLRANGPSTEEESKIIFGQIVSAVHYLHNLDIAHRDLKCENIFLESKMKVKLGDFGFARYCRSKSGKYILSDTFCGSAAYAAPEILQGLHYDPKMYDMWALGCILYTMLNASLPFDDTNINRMVQEQNSGKIREISKFWYVSRNLKKLLNALLEPDLTKRLKINHVVRHPWFLQDSSNRCNLGSISDSFLTLT